MVSAIYNIILGKHSLPVNGTVKVIVDENLQSAKVAIPVSATQVFLATILNL
jgi:hypothetical protein